MTVKGLLYLCELLGDAAGYAGALGLDQPAVQLRLAAAAALQLARTDQTSSDQISDGPVVAGGLVAVWP